MRSMTYNPSSTVESIFLRFDTDGLSENVNQIMNCGQRCKRFQVNETLLLVATCKLQIFLKHVHKSFSFSSWLTLGTYDLQLKQLKGWERNRVKVHCKTAKVIIHLSFFGLSCITETEM